MLGRKIIRKYRIPIIPYEIHMKSPPKVIQVQDLPKGK